MTQMNHFWRCVQWERHSLVRNRLKPSLPGGDTETNHLSKDLQHSTESQHSDTALCDLVAVLLTVLKIQLKQFVRERSVLLMGQWTFVFWTLGKFLMLLLLGIFSTASHSVAHAEYKLKWSSHFRLPSAGTTVMFHHACLQDLILNIIFLPSNYGVQSISSSLQSSVFLFADKEDEEPSLMVHIYNCSTEDVETGGSLRPAWTT
jgi:hypothetical protein